MSRDDYDPHLALAVMAGMCTEEDSDLYKYLDKDDNLKVADASKVSSYKRVKTIRSIAKNGNYACQYGAGAARIALTAGISKEQAETVHSGYWKLNWAIKAVAKDQVVVEIEDQKWLLNPINGFYYSLREEKDRFSTLVQGSASYVFDLWVMNFRKKRPQLTAQFHDEIVITVKEGYREQVKKLLNDAIDLTNQQLKLNRDLGIGIQFGKRYSEIH